MTIVTGRQALYKGNRTLLDHALAYAKRGWSIIPVRGKKPVGLWKPFQQSPADPATLHRLLGKDGITGVAAITGKVSGGLAVRDFDQADAYFAWGAKHPDDAAKLPTVKTARGYHVYGHLDDEAFTTFDDGELRATSGHFIVVPPSAHPDGPAYSWIVPLPAPGTPLPPLPPSLGTPVDPEGRRRTQEHSLTSSICPKILDHARVQQAIVGTLPSGPGLRRKRLFDLARIIKGLFPNASPAELRSVVRDWHTRALPLIRTKPFTDTWTDFIAAWSCCRCPAGKSFKAAAEAAEAGHVPAVCDELGYDGDLRRLAALCYQLQLQWGDHPFPLGCRLAGTFLGASKNDANRMLNALAFDQVIRLEKLGRKSNKPGRPNKASMWRFVASM
jgi:hypothetical protein